MVRAYISVHIDSIQAVPDILDDLFVFGLILPDIICTYPRSSFEAQRSGQTNHPRLSGDLVHCVPQDESSSLCEQLLLLNVIQSSCVSDS